MELEGLRGLAAIVVVIHHFALAFFPFLILAGSVQHNRLEDNIYGTPLALLYAGTFAVAIFFVLSGFVLSIGYFQTKDEGIIKKLAAKRYVRLMVPALASIILCFVLASVGAIRIIDEASAITLSQWLERSWGFNNLSFLDALYNGTVGIFTEQGSPFNNVLWTMKTEFLGSFLIFCFLLVMAKSKYRAIGYSLMVIFTFNSWFLPFVLGTVIADMYANGFLEKIKNKGVATLVLVSGAIFFGTFPNGRISGTMYGWMEMKIPGVEVNTEVLYLTIGAVLAVTAVLTSKTLRRLMQKPAVSNLGKYTFSLYLTHLAVLYTFTNLVFLGSYDVLGYSRAAFVALVASVPIWAGVAYLFERYVDGPSIRLSKRLLDLYQGTVPVPSVRQYLAGEVENYRLAKDSWQQRVSRALRPSSVRALDEE